MNGVEVTIFPVEIERLIDAKSVEFYSTNNPFEAKLMRGDGRVLNKIRREIFGKDIDLGLTKKLWVRGWP